MKSYSLDDPMRVSWGELDRGYSYGDANEQESSVATSRVPSTESMQVSKREKILFLRERNLRHNPCYMHAHLHHLSYKHQSLPRASVFEAKVTVTVGNALKTPEAHHWWRHSTRLSSCLMLNLGDVPFDTTMINSAVVLRKKPDDYKAYL